jgi:hypothetical protein
LGPLPQVRPAPVHVTGVTVLAVLRRCYAPLEVVK